LLPTLADIISYFYYWYFLVLGTKFHQRLTPNTRFTLKMDSDVHHGLTGVAINQERCDSTVHSKRISVVPIMRNCTVVYKYEQSVKLPLDDKEAMRRDN